MNGVRNQTPVPGQRSKRREPLSPVAALVRHHDHDRYQTALFAPADRREALFALYAFNYEIARVREVVTQPTLGHIRLEWWRENIAAAYGTGAIRTHPVIEALTVAIRRWRLTRCHFDRLIDAREADLDLEAPADLAELENYLEATSSRLVYLAVEVLSLPNDTLIAAARHVGIAFAIAGLLRAWPTHSATRRQFIPVDIANRHRLQLGGAQQIRSLPGLAAVTAEIAQFAYNHLSKARRLRPAIPRAALPALLPAEIATQSLARLRRAGYDPFHPAAQSSDPFQIWRLALIMLLGHL